MLQVGGCKRREACAEDVALVAAQVDRPQHWLRDRHHLEADVLALAVAVEPQHEPIRVNGLRREVLAHARLRVLHVLWAGRADAGVRTSGVACGRQRAGRHARTRVCPRLRRRVEKVDRVGLHLVVVLLGEVQRPDVANRRRHLEVCGRSGEAAVVLIHRRRGRDALTFADVRRRLHAARERVGHSLCNARLLGNHQDGQRLRHLSRDRRSVA
eukprot:7169016-Prymnesium_polylepis.1